MSKTYFAKESEIVVATEKIQDVATDTYTYPAGNPGRDDVLKHLQATDTTSKGTMRAVLKEVEGIICGDRHDHYGPPEVNHERTAKLWSVFLGIPITARQVCYCNVLQKCSREVHCSKRDTDLDIAGYVANATVCLEKAITTET